MGVSCGGLRALGLAGTGTAGESTVATGLAWQD